ncbi:MAG: hypothetical protein A2X22_04740 [Bacteroidetes bacterium GWF2_49_14]|nr:MAG: hypothetical protein A2X22_04740 [Bacteroidetes bacterium GWF2_49_14]HBB93188.1 hypothetical protein [Bacteroidales bacterium]
MSPDKNQGEMLILDHKKLIMNGIIIQPKIKKKSNCLLPLPSDWAPGVKFCQRGKCLISDC